MTLERLAERYWNVANALNPTTATLRGIHDYDDQMPRFDDAWLADKGDELRAIIAEAEDLDSATLSVQQRITHALLLHQARSALLDSIETPFLIAAVDPFTGPHTRVLRDTRQYTVHDLSQADALVGRYEKIPTFLEGALALHRQNVDRGMPPALASTERVLGQLDGYLESDLSDDPFLVLDVPGDDGSWRDRVETIVTETIRPAVEAYRDGLREHVAPKSRPHERSGLQWIDGGEALYTRLIEKYTQTRDTPQVIHDIGLRWATEINAAEWAEVGEGALGLADLPTIFARLHSDPSLRFESEEHMLRHARASLERAWAEVDSWFAHRPQAPCDVVPVPAPIAPAMPQAYYLQPPLDRSRPGTYFLNTYRPQERDLFEYQSIHFHEGIPGHHFDRSLAAELEGIPDFRRFAMVYAHTEGWGLYSERLADEMGLYSSELDRLGMIAADAWRAARLVTDTGIHALGWSRQRAIDFMKTWTPVSLLAIEQEVDRYISMPGQALAYKIGQLEILRLRELAEQNLGPRFDISGFHDVMLVNGAMPLPMLRVAVEDWMATAT
ncbi:MAG: DUF885 domain-containing protein [Acidimicrobiia bacterium]|jgi:uncharacterized protein (DUF885 family)